MRFGVIAAEHGPLDAHVVAALRERGLAPSAVILDTKPLAPRDRALVAERTNGRIPTLAWDALGLAADLFSRVDDHNGADALQRATQLRLDWIVNAGTPRILTAGMLGAARHGILNCHPGLLPAFRGASAVEWAILLDEPVGNSVHIMTPGIDEGPILATRATVLPPGASYVDIRVAVYRDGFELMAETVSALAAGRIDPSDGRPQIAGRFFRPIDAASMARVDEILAAGGYRAATPLGASSRPASAVPSR